MYDMTSTPSYEANQQTIIALGPWGNKLESVEWGLSGLSGCSGLSGSSGFSGSTR
jgi:hypothetical protein